MGLLADYAASNQGEAIMAFASVVVLLVAYRLLARGKKRTRKRTKSIWNLDRVLFYFSKLDALTIRQALEGIAIFGATGSGKTSGSAETIVEASMAAGMGVLATTVKTDECRRLIELARRTGRSRDVVVIDKSCRWRFNAVNHEQNRTGAGAGQTENLVDLTTVCLGLTRGGASRKGEGREDGRFWDDAFKQLCRNGFDLLRWGPGRVSIPDLHRVVSSMPKSLAESESRKWMETSDCFQWLLEAERKGVPSGAEAEFQNLQDYFLRKMPGLSDRTRSTIEMTFDSMVDVLNRGLGKQILCTDTTFVPEMIAEGKIVIMDLPIIEFGLVGRMVQGILKYCFQRAIERRDFSPGDRPVLLYSDEFQHFVNEHDMLFQTSCRSAGVATVYVTQNMNTIIAMLGGGDTGKEIAHSICDNLVTKIFHQNTSVETNAWASEMFGRGSRFRVNSSSSSQPIDSFFGYSSIGQNSAGVSEQIEYQLQPGEFAKLSKGGPENNGIVGAYAFQGGRIFRTSGKPWMEVNFRQRR